MAYTVWYRYLFEYVGLLLYKEILGMDDYNFSADTVTDNCLLRMTETIIILFLIFHC